MKALRKTATLIVAAASVISMAACGGGSSSAGSTDLSYPSIELGKTGKDINATIQVFNHRTDLAQSSYKGTTWKQYIAEFNKTYPNIKVKVDTDTNYASDALTRLQGGKWGDIMMIPAVNLSELGNYFLPYGSTADMDKQIKYVHAQEYDGKVYGVPATGTAGGIVYNKAIFQKAGITELPKTTTDFINDLKAIKEKTDATPLYTNYAAGWTMGAWDAYIGGTATGSATYMSQQLLHTKDPFSDPKDGTHAYNVYKILYDAVNDGLTEKDYSTTDWEGSKTQMNDGKIGVMVLGSWAVTQIKSAGSHADDIDYMPFPITVKGKQYTSSGADYSYGINKKSSKANQEASMIFVKWLTEKSNYAYNEGGVSVGKNDDRLPELYNQFKNVKFLIDEPAVKGEEDLFNDLNSDSELGINSNGNARVQAIVEAAFNKSKSFDSIMDGWNQKWNDALKTENVDVKYTTVAK